MSGQKYHSDGRLGWVKDLFVFINFRGGDIVTVFTSTSVSVLILR